jgi:endoglucanase
MRMSGKLWFCSAAGLAFVFASSCLIPPTRMSAAAGATAADDPRSRHNLLANGTFDGGVSLPWTSSFTAPGTGETSVTDGALCLDVTNIGVNRWDAQLRHREMVIQRGHEYRVVFRAWSDKPSYVRPKIGMAGPPYAEYWADTIKLDATPRVFTAEFEMKDKDDPTAEFAAPSWRRAAPRSGSASTTCCSRIPSSRAGPRSKPLRSPS